MAARSCPGYRLSGAGPLLVNVPGLDGTGELIFKQMPALLEHYCVATFRLRESGDFTYTDLAADLAAIIRDVGEEHATVVGERNAGSIVPGSPIGRVHGRVGKPLWKRTRARCVARGREQEGSENR